MPLLHQPDPRPPIQWPELHEIRDEPLPVQIRVERGAPPVADLGERRSLLVNWN